MSYFNSLLTVCFTYLVFVYTSGEKCSGKEQPRNVADFQERLIFSPGYPLNYEINDGCTWTIYASVGSSDYVIQLATIEIDLNDYNNDCNTDYLAVYEGEGTKGNLLDKWCRSDRKTINARQAVTLKFHSDDKFTAKGFVISYSLIKTARTECEGGRISRINVGVAPVYASFLGKLTVPSCEWHIQTDDPNKKLLIELFKPSDVSCENGSFDFYDGGNTNSHVSYEYCSTKKPFSLMFLKSNKVIIIFRNKANSQPDSMILKISERSPFYGCTVSNMPTIEVKDGPVFLALPLTYNTRNTPCPVRIWSADRKKHLRLDVMGTDDKEADCDTDVIQVKEMISNKNIVRSCNREKNPVYRQSSNDALIVTSVSNVYIRAAAVDELCDGSIIKKIAYDSLVQEETVPSDGRYSNLDYCKYLITGEKDNEIIHLSLKWKSVASENLDTKQAVCKGDFINIYDGDSETSPVLFSSCWPNNNTEGLISATIKSSQKHLLVVLDADAKNEGDSFNVKFHSISADNNCQNATEIVVTRDIQTLTSSNYPNSFPMHVICIYNLVSENPDDDIIVKVVEANLHDMCKNFLAVYEGKYKTSVGEKAVGRVCGTDTPTFHISNSQAALIAVSEDDHGDGGWKVEVHTAEKGGHSAGTSLKFSMIVISVLAAHLT